MRPPAGGPGVRPRPAAVAVGVLVAWTAFLAGTAILVHGLGGALAPPPLTDPGQLGRWLEQRQPAEAAIAVARLAVLGLAWYLLVVTVVATVARAADAAGAAGTLARAADAVTPPLVRRLVNGAVGVSFAAVTLTGTGGAALAAERTGPPETSATAETMRRLPDAAPATPPPTPATSPAGRASGAATSPPPTMRRLPATAPAQAPGPATTTASADSAATPEAASPPASANASPPLGERTWPVQPGDHFWAVAERVLAEAWGRAPADVQVDPYWRALVDANATVLRDPGNPDLLFPGQVIFVPAPPAAPPPGG